MTTPGPITYRDIREEDMPFLRELYASTRAEELAQTGWSASDKAAFVDMQFRAQHAHYMTHFAGDSFQIILQREAPIGRLYVGRWTEEIRVIDITLAPERRGGGVGTQIMQGLMEEAGARGVPVRIHVEKNNPALRLYRRLGFDAIEDKQVYLLMEWRDVR